MLQTAGKKRDSFNGLDHQYEENAESEATMAAEREELMHMLSGGASRVNELEDEGHQLNQREVSFGHEDDSMSHLVMLRESIEGGVVSVSAN